MKKKLIRMTALVLMVVFAFGTMTFAAADKKKNKTKCIVVTSQEEFDSALKNGNYNYIRICTTEKIAFTLDEKYSNEDLNIIVEAPNATFKSKGTVKSIVVNDAKTVKEYASGNKITINDEKLTISVMEEAKVASLKIASESGEIKVVNDAEIEVFDIAGEFKVSIVQNGEVGELYVHAAGEIELTGTSTKPLPVTIQEDAAGASIVSALPLDASLYSEAAFVLQKGAGNSAIKMQEASIDLKLENKTGYTVTVKDSTGEEISVGNGEEFFSGKTTESAGQTGTDPEDEEESEEPKDLSEDPSDDDGYENPATQTRVEVKGENVTVNGQLLPDGQVAGVTEDRAVDFLPADEQTNELKNKIDALFTDDKGLESLIGSDGLIHYQAGSNLDYLISSLENFQNYDGLAFNSKGTATVVALAPMDLRLSGKINTLLVGPEAPGINIIQERGLVESMLVLEPDSNLFLGGYVRKLYAARSVTVSTLHRHTPAEKTVYVVEPTTTEGGQYTIVTYCTDPTCGIELDSKTYYTDPLPPPVPEPAPEKEPEPAFEKEPESAPAANPCANGHTGGKATCQAQAICTVCGQPYGELGAHVPGDITPSADGNGSIICCKVCGILLQRIPDLVVEPNP